MDMGRDPDLPRRRPLRPALRLHLQLRRLLRRHRQQPGRLRRERRLRPRNARSLPRLPPRGSRTPWSTFFGRPTGRNCDGRLIIDFIAHRLGLPLVPPSLAHNGSFRRGANFAVGGATTLDAAFFNGDKFPLNTSLGVQLQWFESLKPSLCRTAQECEKFFGRSLFFVGEFGLNDYHFSFLTKSVQETMPLVPDVIATISTAIERLIKHGVTSFVVPGTIPSGCLPPVLVMFADADPAAYNSTTGCLEYYNKLGMHHNLLLQEALEKVRSRHPDVRSSTRIYLGQSWKWWSRLASLGLKKTR